MIVWYTHILLLGLYGWNWRSHQLVRTALTTKSSHAMRNSNLGQTYYASVDLLITLSARQKCNTSIDNFKIIAHIINFLKHVHDHVSRFLDI